MTIIYRTSDPERWGEGKEARLTKVEIDRMMWTIVQRLTAVETNPPTPKEISNITLTGSQLSVHLNDGTIFGPYTIPLAVMRFRGEFANDTAYNELDLVHVIDFGLYLVLRNHTSVAPFDPDAANEDGSLYHRVMPSGLATLPTFLKLLDTPDAFGTAGQYVVVNSTADGLTFTTLPTVTWDAVTNKPTEFPPSAHAHAWGDITSGIPATIAALPAALGADGQVLKVSGGTLVWGADETGGTGGGVSTFLELADTPAAFGASGQLAAVNGTGDGLIFIDPPSGDGGGIADAPIDGQPYVRWDGSWQVMPTVTVTWAEVTDKPAEFPPSAHTHAWGDLTSGVPAAVAALPNAIGADGQVLKASAGGIVWGADETGEGGTGGATALDGLSDVDTTTTPPVDGQALVWDAINGVWLPGSVASGGYSTSQVVAEPIEVPLVNADFESGIDLEGWAIEQGSATAAGDGSGGYGNAPYSNQQGTKFLKHAVADSSTFEVSQTHVLDFASGGFIDIAARILQTSSFDDLPFVRLTFYDEAGIEIDSQYKNATAAAIDIWTVRQFFFVVPIGTKSVKFGFGGEYVTGTVTNVGIDDIHAKAFAFVASGGAVTTSGTIEYTGSRTLVLSDAEQYLRCTDAADSALTVPPETEVAFPLNTTIHHRTAGAGKVTLTPGTGVTLNPPFGQTLVTPGAGATLSLKKVGADEWDVMGHTEVAA